MAKIVKSAIRFHVSHNTELVIAARRHADAYEQAYKMLGFMPTAEEGFITSKDQFVDRYEAKYLAWDAGQVMNQDGPLYSEDIWPDDD